MKNLSKIVLYVLLAVSVVVMGLFFFGGGEDIALFDAGNPDADTFYVPNYTSLAINLAKFFLIGAIVVTLLVSVMSFLLSPKESAKGLLGIAFIAVVLFIAYALSSAEPIKLPGQEALYTNAFDLRLADVMMYSAYGLLGLTFVSIILSYFVKNFR